MTQRLLVRHSPKGGGGMSLSRGSVPGRRSETAAESRNQLDRGRLGRRGERIAEKLLRRAGLIVLARNWRLRRSASLAAL